MYTHVGRYERSPSWAVSRPLCIVLLPNTRHFMAFSAFKLTLTPPGHVPRHPPSTIQHPGSPQQQPHQTRPDQPASQPVPVFAFSTFLSVENVFKLKTIPPPPPHRTGPPEPTSRPPPVNNGSNFVVGSFFCCFLRLFIINDGGICIFRLSFAAPTSSAPSPTIHSSIRPESTTRATTLLLTAF